MGTHLLQPLPKETHLPATDTSFAPSPMKRQFSAVQVLVQNSHVVLRQLWPSLQSASPPQVTQSSSTCPLQSSSTPLPQISVALGRTLGSVSLQSPPG